MISGQSGLVFNEITNGDGPSTLVNFGTVQGTGTAQFGVLLNVDGMIFNGQSGATGALIQGGSYGIYATAQGTVVNYATITGGGVSIHGTGAVSNLGTAALIEGTNGVLIGTNGTVINSGTISSSLGTSGSAVTFGGGDLRLIDEPGAVFIGQIFGGTGGTAVMELASGSSVGTISGFGGSVTNFTSLAFDPGALWSVAGDDQPGGLGALGISGFTIGDTIDLTGFAAVSRTFASDALVLTDAFTNHETLHIQGSFATAGFVIAGDNAGGTDITMQTVLAYGQTIDAAGIIATSETVTAGVLTLFNSLNQVGSIAVGTSLSTGDFQLSPDGVNGTDVIVSSIFGTYTSGVTLLVPRSTVTSTGTVSGAIGGTGIIGPSGVTVWTLVNNGSVSAASGVVLNGAGTVINAGSVAGTSHYGIWLKAGGYVSNAASGVISAGTASGFGVYVKAGSAGTVVNAGEITAFDGIILKSPGTVINSGTIGAALGEGIGSYGGGNVSNAASGVISAKYSGIVLAGGSAASVVNAGNVTSAKYAGVYLSDTGDMLTNTASGIIKGVIGVLLNAAGTLINNGQIVASGSSVPGVALTGGGTVDNAGTISTSSGTAVAFGGVSAGRLIDHPGAVFTGAVVASAYAASSTLELVFAPPPALFSGSAPGSGDLAPSWSTAPPPGP